jgi:hypothetical protein
VQWTIDTVENATTAAAGSGFLPSSVRKKYIKINSIRGKMKKIKKKRGEGWRERERERKSTRASLDCGQDEKIVSPVKTFDVKSHSRSPTQKSLSHRTVKRANSILEKKRKKKFVQIYEHTQYADVFFL